LVGFIPASASRSARDRRNDDRSLTLGLIDWVQDAAREQLRRKARRRRQSGRVQRDWKQRIQESYDAAQGWIVITIIGAAIGLNAGFINIVTEWLADIKLGHCKNAFYLNENFCCWGEDNGRQPLCQCRLVTGE